MEDVNAKDGMGFTPLMRACTEKNLELTKSLLENGADIEAQNNDGRTALMWACESGNIEIVSFLIEKGANLNVKDNSGLTALCAATQNGHFPVVKLLVESGANFRIKINGTVLAIDEAKKGGYEQIAQYLEERLENSHTVYGNCDLHKTMKAVKYCEDCGNLMCETCASSSSGETTCPSCALKFWNKKIFYLQEWLSHTKFSLKLSGVMWGVVIIAIILFGLCMNIAADTLETVLAIIMVIAWIVAGVKLPAHFEYDPNLIMDSLILRVIKYSFYVIASPILIIVFLIAYKRKKKTLESYLVTKAHFEEILNNTN